MRGSEIIIGTLTSTSEGCEVVTTFPIEQGGVGQSPYILCLYFSCIECGMGKHPHKQREEILIGKERGGETK